MNRESNLNRRERKRRSSRGEPRMAAASLVIIGLIIGIAIALYYAWIFDPVVYVAASPARLSDLSKREYISLVSQSFAVDGNWDLAQERLEALDDPEIENTVKEQIEDALRSGVTAEELGNLANLGAQLGVRSQAIALFVPLEETTFVISPTIASNPPTPTLLPTPTTTKVPTVTPSPIPTATGRPSPTPIPIYRLLNQERVCDVDAPAPRIEVIVVDSLLEPLPGVEVIVQWEEGQDNFFTGYKQELGLGYSDFIMSPDIFYDVVIADGSPVISDLTIDMCDEDEGGLAGGWRLVFQNTNVSQEPSTPEA